LAAYYGITGTPGTGKKTLAPLVASRLRIPCRSLNDLARSYHLSRRGGSEAEVDAPELGRRALAALEPPCLLYGHLLPYAFRRGAFSKVVVLRCDPRVLRARLVGRGYGTVKVRQNVEAELIGLVSSDSVAAFGRDRVAEVDTSKATVSASAAAVASRLTSPGGPPAADWVRSYGSAARLRSLLGPKTFSA